VRFEVWLLESDTSFDSFLRTVSRESRHVVSLSHHTLYCRSRRTQIRFITPEREIEEETVQDLEPEPPVDPETKKIIELELKAKGLLEEVDELRLIIDDTRFEVTNAQKRAKRAVENAKEFCIEQLCSRLFMTCDTLNIILQNKPNFDLPKHRQNQLAKIAFDGAQQVKTLFAQAMADSYEIVEFMPEIGAVFDPMYLNAVCEVDAQDDTDLAPGRIGLVVKSGWKRKNLLLRPAAVGVVRQPIKIRPLPEGEE